MYVDPTGMQALEEGYDKRDGNSEEKKEVGWIDFPKDENDDSNSNNKESEEKKPCGSKKNKNDTASEKILRRPLPNRGILDEYNDIKAEDVEKLAKEINKLDSTQHHGLFQVMWRESIRPGTAGKRENFRESYRSIIEKSGGELRLGDSAVGGYGKQSVKPSFKDLGWLEKKIASIHTHPTDVPFIGGDWNVYFKYLKTARIHYILAPNKIYALAIISWEQFHSLIASGKIAVIAHNIMYGEKYKHLSRTEKFRLITRTIVNVKNSGLRLFVTDRTSDLKFKQIAVGD